MSTLEESWWTAYWPKKKKRKWNSFLPSSKNIQVPIHIGTFFILYLVRYADFYFLVPLAY